MKNKLSKALIMLISMCLLSFIACNKDDDEDEPDQENGTVSEYKQKMKNFVQEISSYAKAIDQDFIIIPQNGHELVSDNGDTDGSPETNYLSAIDALGQEDLLYGYDYDDIATPAAETTYLTALLDMAKNSGKTILVTDYCSTQSKMDDSYSKNYAKGYISFAASSRELDIIPPYPDEPYNMNPDNIGTVSAIKNFLYIINPSNFSSSQEFVNVVAATNYDLIIMDLFFNDTAFTSNQIQALQLKNNGGQRMVVAYMSIGEAEDYRYYWQTAWVTNPPSWLDEENPEWAGNYKVKYWEQEWKDIIFGNDNSYLKKILNAGFDGVYLDIIEAFEHFE